MKTKIVSSLLSLIFVSILGIEYLSHTMLAEITPTETIEYVFEKRISDKLIDNTGPFSSSSYITTIKVKIDTIFKETFYTFKSNNTLFRPPIKS